jgi:hypothetical protein
MPPKGKAFKVKGTLLVAVIAEEVRIKSELYRPQ